MNDTIKVGDRVYRWVDRDAGYVLRATRGPWAWIERDDGTFRTVGLGSLALTRIEPEKVVLTPKYGKGDRVRGRHSHQIYTIEEPIDIKYRTAEGFNVTEHEVCPVPEPCPECKGSGVASEGGA